MQDAGRTESKLPEGQKALITILTSEYWEMSDEK